MLQPGDCAWQRQLRKVYTRIRYEVFFGTSTSTLLLFISAGKFAFPLECTLPPPGDSPYYWKRAAMETVISAVETCLIAYATY